MGSSRYSDDEYASRASLRAATNTPVFKHDADIKSGKVASQTHAKLDPKGVDRESRDSDVHPESLAIGVMFDVTGSMNRLPGQIQQKLPTLMNLLISKGYVEHPQILFGAIGDAYSDKAPLQVGQFESGLEMEDDIQLIFLEGNGGGQRRESYQLAHYFFARHTKIDCHEKRGKKGYLFTMGDEAPYLVIDRHQVERLIGDTLESDIRFEDLLKELTERYEVFHIICEQGSYPHDTGIETEWTKLLGERVLKLEDINGVAELIATTIGLCEGTTDMATAAVNLKDAGTSAGIIGSVEGALAKFVPSVAMSRTGTVEGVLAASAPSIDRI